MVWNIVRCDDVREGLDTPKVVAANLKVPASSPVGKALASPPIHSTNKERNFTGLLVNMLKEHPILKDFALRVQSSLGAAGQESVGDLLSWNRISDVEGTDKT